MPLFDYRCPSGHVTTLLEKRRQEQTDCATCTLPATYSLAAPARGIVQGSTTPGQIRVSPTKDGFTTLYETESFVLRQKGTSLTRADYVCEDGHAFGDDYPGDPPVNPECGCGKPMRRIVVASDIDWITKTYPHGWFDPALGCFIRDRAHWEAVKKEKGVIDGDFRQAWADQCRRDSEQAEHDEAEMRKMLHEQFHGRDAAIMHRFYDEHPEMDPRALARELGVIE